MINITPERKIEILTAFNQNLELKQCLKDELLAGLYRNGVQIQGQEHDSKRNWALQVAWNDELSPEQKGAQVMAIAEGLRFLESAFDKIESTYKVEVKKDEAVNPAR